jgi:hypothetical protein
MELQKCQNLLQMIRRKQQIERQLNLKLTAPPLFIEDSDDEKDTQAMRIY